VGQAADLGLFQRPGVLPFVRGIGLSLRHADMVLGIAGKDLAAIDSEAGDAQPDTGGQGLNHLVGRSVNEDKVALVLDDKCFAVVHQRQLNGPAREQHLRAGWLENLVSGYDNPAVGLDAHRELVAVVAGYNCKGRRVH
jgi:hypothetical protein